MIRKYSGSDLWDYMYQNVELDKIKGDNGEEELPSYQIIDEILDVGEQYVELHEIGPGWFFTNKARMLKPHEWYWAHPSFASKSSLGLVPNAYNALSPNPYTISSALKKHFGIMDKQEILNIRVGLMEMHSKREEYNIIRRTNPYE
jgi:hypothetical protein